MLNATSVPQRKRRKLINVTFIGVFRYGGVFRLPGKNKTAPTCAAPLTLPIWNLGCYVICPRFSISPFCVVSVCVNEQEKGRDSEQKILQGLWSTILFPQLSKSARTKSSMRRTHLRILSGLRLWARACQFPLTSNYGTRTVSDRNLENNGLSTNWMRRLEACSSLALLP